jgi:hypothetical protein
MELKDWIGVASAVVSVIAITISWTISRLSARASVRPVLVFEYPPDEGWKAKNIGSGPALNVLIARAYIVQGGPKAPAARYIWSLYFQLEQNVIRSFLIRLFS